MISGVIDLAEVFPAGRGESRRENGIAVRDGIFSSPAKPELEACLAAWTAFGPFDLAQGPAPDIFQPGRVVIFIIDDFQSE
jgi:hypothetical protein